MSKKFVARIVDFSGRHPIVVVLATLALLVGAWFYASRIELRSDLLELLPRDSPGFQAFEHQLGRVGGGATLIVVVESPDRKQNERFVDALDARLAKTVSAHAACLAACNDDACRAACGPNFIRYVESGTKVMRRFFDEHKWLYAELSDLEAADQKIDQAIAFRSGFVENLLEDASPEPPPSGSPRTAPSAAPPNPAPRPPASPPKHDALGVDEFSARWREHAQKLDDFPTGYFAVPDGTMMGIRIVTGSSGLGDMGGDSLLARVEKMVTELDPASFHASMRVGFAGDIPNAKAEKDSIVSDALAATLLAFGLIVAGVVVFYRSVWALVIIALPVFVGVGAAYAFAMATFGYVNTSGAFLGAIILGNGINYPIVLLSRYREFRKRGMTPDVARREAVHNAFRAELVGAAVASIAYGSLTVTRFRGFSQFGTIGFVGMLLVWIAIIPVVPATIVITEAVQAWIDARLAGVTSALRRRVPGAVSRGFAAMGRGAAHAHPMRIIAWATGKAPWLFIGLAFGLSVFAASKLPRYLKDPWQYDFNRLGSRSSKVGGAGEWSNKADAVFGGKMNIAGALMLADTPEQVPLVKAKILANDAADPEGSLIAGVATVLDFLPGTPQEQRKKLEVLDRIRDRLSPDVLARLDPDERERVKAIIPPATLGVVTAEELPPLLRRRFEENDGKVGTVFYVRTRNEVSLSDGKNMLRIARATDNVELPDGHRVQTASRSTIFSELIRSMERDGPLATATSFGAVVLVVLVATSSLRGAFAVILALVFGVLWTVGGAAHLDEKLNYISFVALPITFGIGCEYPFNIFDRSRLLGGDVREAVRRSGGAVAMCSYTTIIGYGSLLVSDQQALQSFGRLAVSGEIACVFAALLFLPALLHVMPKKKNAPVRVR
ncbi:MAG: MMPL family transporter [Polyangiaceae bacterium]